VHADPAPGPFVLNFRPTLGSDTDPADIGALVREVAPKEMRAVWKTVHRTHVSSDSGGDAAELASQLEDVAGRLAQDGISPEEVSRAAAELRELAARQAELGREESEVECCTDD